jgi:hypothetical protein
VRADTGSSPLVDDGDEGNDDVDDDNEDADGDDNARWST